MVEITENNPGTSKKRMKPPPAADETEVEIGCVNAIWEYMPDDVSREMIIRHIRKRIDARNDAEFHSTLTSDIFLEKDQKAALDDQQASTATDAMDCTDVIALPSSSVVVKSPRPAREDTDYQRAIQESLTTVHQSYRPPILPANMEEMIRNPLLSTGLYNSGNTCWFNCLAQLLYSLPKFRSLIYHCVPCTWFQSPIMNVKPENAIHAELLLLFRKLFAEMQFSSKKFIEAGPLLSVVDTLYCRTGTNVAHILGTQQDATELLMQILEWLEMALNAALHAQLHPELSIEVQVEENLVVADSTTDAPNSDVAGTAPPGYDQVQPSASSVHREPQSRPNSPVNKAKVETAPLPSIGSIFGTRTAKDPLSTIDESMDTSESSMSRPLPSKVPRILSSNTENLTVTEETKDFVSSLRQQFDDIFSATCYSADVSDDGVVTNEREVRSCPQFFQIPVSYGNLHDALEAGTFDTGRTSVSHTQNLYEKLPAVIFMGLSRFFYDDNVPNKLHNKFTFPRTIFMDRYLKHNLDQVLELRKEQVRLRYELAEKKAQLNGLRYYPHGNGGQTPLKDAFQTVFEAGSNYRRSEKPEDLSAFKGPLLPTVNENSSKFVQDLGKIFPEFREDAFPDLQSCLNTIRTIYERLNQEEQVCINREAELEHMIENIYEKESLHNHQYELHAMIVHSGEATRGHYWTYRLKKSIDDTENWEKLNDQNVTNVPWSQVEKDAFGTGFRDSPSAYLLMYVRSDAEWLVAADKMTEQETLSNLPDDLREFVSLKQEEFQNDLDRFREERKAANRPTSEASHCQSQETTNSFTWYRHRYEEIGDLNANPTIEEYTVSDRLPIYQTPLATPSELKRMNDMIQVIFNVISTIDPSRCESSDDLLNIHINTMIADEGVATAQLFFEQRLPFPVHELKAEDENDVEKAYNMFMEDFLSFSLQHLNNRARFDLFVFSQLGTVHTAVLRYLMVRALLHPCFGGVTERARQEMNEFIQNTSDQGQALMKITKLLAHIYDLGTLLSWECRKVLSFLKDTDKKFKHFYSNQERLEHTFGAMLEARNARVCHRLLDQIANFMEQPTLFFVSQACLEICTIMPLWNMLKLVVQHLGSRAFTVKDMEFHLSSKTTDSRITIQRIEEEIESALNGMKIWMCIEGRDEMVEEQQTSIEHIPSRLPNLKGVFEGLVAVISVLRMVKAVESTEEKLQFTDKLQIFVTSEYPNMEKPTRSMCLSSASHSGAEIIELERLFNELSGDIIDKIMKELGHLVEQQF